MADWYFRNNQGHGQGALTACPGCRNLVRKDEEFCPYCARRLRPPGGVRGFLKRLEGVPFLATRGLLALIVAMFLIQVGLQVYLFGTVQREGAGLFGLFASNNDVYTLLGSNDHRLVYDGVFALQSAKAGPGVYQARFTQVWRFLTSCFLHYGLFHIVFNCWAFWDLGRLAERLWGTRQLFATYVLTGIVGSAASYGWDVLTVSDIRQLHPSVGASGAICGVIGLLLGAYYRNRYHVGEFLGTQLVRWAVTILVLGFVAGFDNAAHFGGMASGAVLGYFLWPTQHAKNLARDRRIWNAATVLSLLLLVAAFAGAGYFTAIVLMK